MNCIYACSKLCIGDYAIEHFIPYAFVSHDLMWNQIQADRSFNCSTNDKLHSLGH
ncbi:MAG: HNH endonuclease domain-containing protein [Daejeonella sp.]